MEYVLFTVGLLFPFSFFGLVLGYFWLAILLVLGFFLCWASFGIFFD